MLVLTRKVDEQILIADGLITLTIVRIGQGVVRIGIDAPPDVGILRGELRDRQRDTAKPADSN